MIRRVYSRDPEPHRTLKRGSGQRGADVRALRAAGLRRLDARDITRTVGPDDGVLNDHLFKALKTTAHFLGAEERWADDGNLYLREQQIIRYPGTRTAVELAAADARMAKLLRQREAAERERRKKIAAQAAGVPGTSGFSSEQRARARTIAVGAFRLAYLNRYSVHYTQGYLRWQGISRRLRAGSGQYPNYADCSAMFTWAAWNAATAVAGYGVRDFVNGQGWNGGYTGSMALHGRWIPVNELKPGDALFYGGYFPYGHVTMYAGNGMCYSHGNEAGPSLVPIHYRTIMTQRRYF